ncbi:MAG: glycosyltransferase [Candidatus Helarchaeota archaeon]
MPDKRNLKIKIVCKEYFNTKVTHIIFLLKLINVLRKYKFDVIHVFNFPGASLLPIFCKKYQKKWILDIQTGADEYKIKNYILDKLTYFEAKFFGEIFTLSKGLENKLFRDNFSNKIYIIPLGANLRRFKRALTERNNWKFQNKNNNKILIYIGDLNRNRKIENLLKAFQIVLNKYGKRIALVIIGGKNKDLERLSNYSESLGVSNHVRFLGRIEYEEIPYYLINSDLGLSYIPKSEMYDVQPALKTLEYLAASLPVVATNTQGNLEIIENEYNGLIATDDYKDYADKIIKCLNNQDLKNKIKCNALNSVKKYDWNNIVDYLTKIYEIQ